MGCRIYFTYNAEYRRLFINLISLWFIFVLSVPAAFSFKFEYSKQGPRHLHMCILEEKYNTIIHRDLTKCQKYISQRFFKEP